MISDCSLLETSTRNISIALDCETEMIKLMPQDQSIRDFEEAEIDIDTECQCNQELREQVKELTSVRNQLEDKCDDLLNKLEQQLYLVQDLRSQLSAAKQDLHYHEDETQRLKDDIESFQRTDQELREEIRQLKEHNEVLEGQIEFLKTSKNASVRSVEIQTAPVQVETQVPAKDHIFEVSAPELKLNAPSATRRRFRDEATNSLAKQNNPQEPENSSLRAQQQPQMNIPKNESTSSVDSKSLSSIEKNSNNSASSEGQFNQLENIRSYDNQFPSKLAKDMNIVPPEPSPSSKTSSGLPIIALSQLSTDGLASTNRASARNNKQKVMKSSVFEFTEEEKVREVSIGRSTPRGCQRRNPLEIDCQDTKKDSLQSPLTGSTLGHSGVSESTNPPKSPVKSQNPIPDDVNAVESILSVVLNKKTEVSCRV